MKYQAGDTVIISRPRHIREFRGYWGIVDKIHWDDGVSIFVLGRDSAYFPTEDGDQLVEKGRAGIAANFYPDSLEIYQATNRNFCHRLKKV